MEFKTKQINEFSTDMSNNYDLIYILTKVGKKLPKGSCCNDFDNPDISWLLRGEQEQLYSQSYWFVGR